jgi:hypothetical protein
MSSNSSIEPHDSGPGREVLCPSARPEMDGALIHGVVGGTVEAPRVRYLAEPQVVTVELLALANPVLPTEVFRFAAPCAGAACSHFDGANCRLAQRVIQLLPDVVDNAPPCRIRPHCRWWRQEGVAACLRCPQIVSETSHPSALMDHVATGREESPATQ